MYVCLHFDTRENVYYFRHRSRSLSTPQSRSQNSQLKAAEEENAVLKTKLETATLQKMSLSGSNSSHGESPVQVEMLKAEVRLLTAEVSRLKDEASSPHASRSAPDSHSPTIFSRSRARFQPADCFSPFASRPAVLALLQ
jgi:uncharacterized small protein (DUF1192 family)